MRERQESYYIPTKGESPINWRLTTFPRDARLVLHLRTQVERYMQEYPIIGPVADLEVEQLLMDTQLSFRRMHDQVNQAITFALPTGILKVLSRL